MTLPSGLKLLTGSSIRVSLGNRRLSSNSWRSIHSMVEKLGTFVDHAFHGHLSLPVMGLFGRPYVKPSPIILFALCVFCLACYKYKFSMQHSSLLYQQTRVFCSSYSSFLFVEASVCLITVLEFFVYTN